MPVLMPGHSILVPTGFCDAMFWAEGCISKAEFNLRLGGCTVGSTDSLVCPQHFKETIIKCPYV